MKKALVVLVVLVGLLVLAGIAVVLLVDLNAYKPRIETAVSDALGMEFRIRGKAALRILPPSGVAFSDIALRNRGSELASAETFRVGVKLLPLLSRRVEVTDLIVEKPVLRLEKGEPGRLNNWTPPVVKKPSEKKPGGPAIPLSVANIAVRDGTLVYVDRKDGAKTEISGLNLSVKDLSLPADTGEPLVRGVRFSGALSAKKIRAGELAATDVNARLTASGGVFDVSPFTMTLFGGKGEAEIHADLSKEKPALAAKYAVSNLRTEELLSAVKQKKSLSGPLTLSGNLSFRGNGAEEMKRTATGQLSVRGDTLTLETTDGAKTEFSGASLSLEDLSFRGGAGEPLVKTIRFSGALSVKKIAAKDLSVSDVDAKVTASDGVFHIRPFTMKLFGGKGEGEIRADLSKEKPALSANYTVSNFRAEESLAAVTQKKYLRGPLTLSENLSFRGNEVQEMRRTASGQVSLRGENLSVEGMDIDRVLSSADQAMKLNLVDVGAFVLAGPLGSAATKGYGFAGIKEAAGVGGETTVTKLVSDWTVRNGIAETRDVAFATRKNRIALRGSLDIVNERFVDVTVAVLDAKGCAKLQQRITGPFRNPQVDKISSLESLIAPVLGLFKETRRFVDHSECKPFYTGSVPQPK